MFKSWEEKDEVEDLEEERKKKQVVWCGAQFVLGGGPTTNGSARSMNINIAFFEPRPGFFSTFFPSLPHSQSHSLGLFGPIFLFLICNR